MDPKKILMMLLGLLGLLAPPIAKALGWDLANVGSMVQVIGTVTMFLGGLLHVSPDLKDLMTRDLQEALAKLGMVLSAAGTLAASAKFPHAASWAVAIGGAGASLSAFFHSSPAENAAVSLKCSPVAIVVALLFLLIGSTAWADTKTSSAAPAAKLLGLDCQRGICPAVPVALAVVGLDGKFHVAETAAGLGADYRFDVGKQPVSVGLAVAPLIRLDHERQDGRLALMLDAGLYHGLTIGLLWSALDIGGPSPGFHGPAADRLYLFGGVDVLEAVWGR
jgi:energy-converting hydrogenase Eha subunit C